MCKLIDMVFHSYLVNYFITYYKNFKKYTTCDSSEDLESFPDAMLAISLTLFFVLLFVLPVLYCVLSFVIFYDSFVMFYEITCVVLVCNYK